MEIKMPELSENAKMLGNKLHKFLIAQQKPVDKKTMCEFMGWEYTPSNDRKLRIVLSNIAKVKPLISTSDQKGYYIAKTKADLEAIEHQIKELDSRIQELEARKAPLWNLRDKIKWKN